ncbi:MAG: dephospho-CoA kinase [Candidatus Fermentibacteraceae bacterium]
MLVGLTGNSGSGASTVAGFWHEAGATVCSLDHTGHRMMEKARIKTALGIDPSITGEAARELLREKAFTDPALLALINRSMHPVMTRWAWFCAARLRNLPGIRVLEGALIFEMGMAGAFDATVAVVDTPERAFLRIFNRDGVTRAAMRGRWENQLPPSEKAQRADLVIHNSGSIEELKEVSISVYTKLIKMEVHRG